MDLDAAAVDEQPIRRILGTRKRAENALPYATFGPADEAIVERLLRPIDIGAIRPATTTTQCMDDAAQNPAIINTRLAPYISRQQGLDPLPLRIGKPKEISHLTTSRTRQ